MSVKPKVYFYSHARERPTHGGPRCHTPFLDGADGQIEVTENPDESDLFFAGQYHDSELWKLQPNRLAFFAGKEDKHVFDLDGDRWQIPDWLRVSLLSVMTNWPRPPGWRIMVRPGSGTLLVDLAKHNTQGFIPASQKKDLVLRPAGFPGPQRTTSENHKNDKLAA